MNEQTLLARLFSAVMAFALTAFAATSATTGPPAPTQTPRPRAHVQFSVIKTGHVTTSEGLLFKGGDFGKSVDSNFSAFLIERGDESLLLDTGMGSQIAAQYEQDMPRWQRLFFKYGDVISTAKSQLAGAGMANISAILLSHSHWDHASGLSDFAGVPIWLTEPEHAYLKNPNANGGRAWPSQVDGRDLNWQPVALNGSAYMGFERSLDVFKDGSVVLVPLFGHTPGSMGVFVTVTSGKRYFFVGDVIWSVSALKKAAPKFWPASLFVDQDRTQTQHAIEQIQAALALDPELIVVPAHDSEVQNKLGYFPARVR